MINDQFVTMLRIDPGTLFGRKESEYSHYHMKGAKKHYSPRPGDDNPLDF